MNVMDLNSMYQNRPLLDKMQRNSGAEKHKSSNSDFAETLKTQASKPQQPQPIDKKSSLYQACQDFESIFIKQMLSAMRKNIQKTGFIEGGMAEEVFEDMLYDEYAKKMAQTAQFGLSETLYKQLSAKTH